MKAIKLNDVFLVVGLTVLFAMTTPANAGEPPPGDYKYAPPPFTGQLTLSFQDPFLQVCGTLEQMGNSGQIINFGTSPSCFKIGYGFVSAIPFQDLTSKDLQGLTFSYQGSLEDLIVLEIMGVGKLYWDGDSEFSAHFVIMELELR